MKEKDPGPMSIVKSGKKCYKSQKAIVTLPSKMQSDNNLTNCLLNKPHTSTNLCKDKNQEESSLLRIPKLASPLLSIQSFGYPSYMSSAHLHGMHESDCYNMPELFLDPVVTSYVDLYGETAEMYEGYTDFVFRCNSPVVKATSEYSFLSLPSISSPERSSLSSTSNSKSRSPSLDLSETWDSSSDESNTMDLKNFEWSKEKRQSEQINKCDSFYYRSHFDTIRKQLFR